MDAFNVTQLKAVVTSYNIKKKTKKKHTLFNLKSLITVACLGPIYTYCTSINVHNCLKWC